MFRAPIIVALLISAAPSAIACSIRGYTPAKPPLATELKQADDPAPAIAVQSLVRGSYDDQPGSCADAGILTLTLGDGASLLGAYTFELLSGGFPDTVLPTNFVSPIKLATGDIGFMFAWLDLPAGTRHVEPFEATIRVRSISSAGLVSEATDIKISDAGGFR
jgi:hypothetical protein